MTEYTIIDVDAHITEAPDTWTSRVAAKYVDRVPHVSARRRERRLVHRRSDGVTRWADRARGVVESRAGHAQHL